MATYCRLLYHDLYCGAEFSGDDLASYGNSSISCCSFKHTLSHMDITGLGLFVPMWLCLFVSTLFLCSVGERSVVISLVTVQCRAQVD